MSTLVVDDNDVTDGLRNKKAASMTNEFASVKSLSNDDESIIIDDAHARSSGIIIRRRAALHIELLESSHNEDVPITLQEYDIDFDDQINETTNLLKPLSIEDKSHHHHESTRVLPKEQSKHGGSSSSMATSIFNLVNNVAGAGLLTLSGGQASGNGTGWIPAILISTILGFIAAVTFIMIGTSCELMKEYNFKGLWSHTIGSRTSYLVDGMIFCLCFAVAIIYSGILGDIFTKLLIENYTNIPDYYSTLRAINIILITTSFILPMSIMKNLSSLSFTSFLGFVSILYTTIFICWRSLDGSYQLETGKFVVSNHEEQHQNSTLTTIIELPSFNNVTMWNFNFASLILISNYGLAYVAHYNAPIFYRELTGTNIPKFTSMVIISFIILIALYTITMIAGYKTFGDTCKGNILLNYHPDDTLSTVARIATGCSILFGYPLVMAGVRESLLNITSHFGYHNLCGSKGTNDRNHVTIVVVMLAIITFTSIVVQDISVVVGVTGAAMGSCIVYICPALIYTKAIEITYGDESLEYQKALWSLTLIPFGIIIAALGVYMSLREFF